MKYQYAAVPLIVAALALTPLAPAEAHGWGHRGWGGGHGGGGLALGVAAGVGAIVGAAATIVTAPFAAVGDAFAPAPVYAAPQAYAPAAYAPAPTYVYAQPTYYQQPRPVAYSYPAYGYPTYVYR